MTTTAPSQSRDPLTTLVQRLPPITAREEAGTTLKDDCSLLEETLQIGDDVRLVRRPGGFYIALVEVGPLILPHLLDAGLGRLVWTLATARPSGSCERARRILTECGI
jgi:hypothetical protein